MRVLSFIVDKQIITPDPKCDFRGLVPGTSDYLKAEFSFSPEWKGTVKVVGFLDSTGKEYPPQVLKDGKTCVIPSEALKNRAFKLHVLGKRGKFMMTTNPVRVVQDGGGA